MPNVMTTTHWNELTERYDPVMSSDPAYRSLLATVIRLMPEGCQRILDLGCGSGALIDCSRHAFPDARIIGLDPAPKMIEQARQKFAASPNITFVEGTASDLSGVEPGSIDAVISNFALHHLVEEEKHRCAAEVFRVLRPGGRFINGDQHCAITGPIADPARVIHLIDLLTTKAKYYLLNASFDRMLLQLELLPRFIREDGEILTTPEFWRAALQATGFEEVTIEVIEPAELMNRVIWAARPRRQA